MKRLLVPSVAAIVLLVLLIALWLVIPLGGGQVNEQSDPTPRVSPTSFNEQEADAQAVSQMLSGLTDKPSEGISALTRPSFDAESALPKGSKISPEAASWAPDGIGGGTINVVMTVPGQADSRYVAVMVKEDGQWKLLGTMEQTEGSE